VLFFGLTGGIASGKSAVGRRFRERGVPIVDADEIAREVVLPGSAGLHEIVNAFGEQVLSADRTLDRKKMGAIVFADDTKRRQLNAILHPKITQATMAHAATLAAQGEPLACYEAALLVENGVADMFRPLVVVAVSKEVQLARLIERDHCSAEEASQRVASQLPLEEKTRIADYVLNNNGTLADLHREADSVLERICQHASIDVTRYPR